MDCRWCGDFKTVSGPEVACPRCSRTRSITEFASVFVDHRDLANDANSFAEEVVDSWGVPKNRGEFLAAIAAAFDAGMRWRHEITKASDHAD